MIKLTSRRAALVLAGSAVALVGGMLPAQAATTGWRPVAKVSVKGDTTLLTGVDAVAKGDAWAVGAAVTTKDTKPVGIIEHWRGKSWRRVTLPAAVEKAWNRYSGMSFPVVGASSATNVWAFSQNLGAGSGSDGYVRLAGRKWTVGTLPGTRAASGKVVVITATRVISSKDVWVFGGKLKVGATSLSFAPYAAQYNGHKWTLRSIPGAGAVVGVSEASPGNMWAAIGTPELFAAPGGAGKHAVGGPLERQGLGSSGRAADPGRASGGRNSRRASWLCRAGKCGSAAGRPTPRAARRSSRLS